MSSDNNEEIQFKSPDDSSSEPTGTERIRPGLKGMSWKVLLWLTLAGLVPVLIMLPVLIPLAQSSPEIHQKIAKQAESLRQRAFELEQSLADLQKEQTDQKLRGEKNTYELSARRSYKNLAKKLAALLSALKTEEIAADRRVKTAIESAAGPFLEVAILNTDTKKVLFTKSDKPAGSLEKTFPVLHKAFTPSQPPGAHDIPGWHWAPVGRTSFALVVFTPEFKPEVQPPPSPAPASPGSALSDPGSPAAKKTTVPAALQTADLDEFDRRLSRLTWILSIALPLLAVVLMACAFLWLRSGLLAPLSRITRSARTVLENPDQVADEHLARPGLLGDLTATLSRVAVRMQRLGQQDRLAIERQDQINTIEQTLARAISGDLGSRVTVEPGECETLAMGVNRLLESLVERFEAVAQASSRMKSSAETIRDLSDRLGRTLTPAGDDRPPANPGPLGAILGIQLETLCQSVGEITESLFSGTPRKWTPEDHDAMTGSMSSSRAGLQVLTQRAQEARVASQRINDLRQTAEVLSTNMAVAAEARSWHRLDELTDDARNLSREIAEFCGSLGNSLDNVSRSSDELKDTFQKTTRLSLQCEKLVGSWESLRDNLERYRHDLLRQIEAIRPGAGSLGSDIRSISKQLSEYREISTGKQKILQGVSESTSELSKTAVQVMSELKKLSISEPTPAAVTQELAAKQQALEKAISKIGNLAAEEGIESLSEDARIIIDQIRAAADEARQRVLSEPKADA
jgi:hypothetical protein